MKSHLDIINFKIYFLEASPYYNWIFHDTPHECETHKQTLSSIHSRRLVQSGRP